MIKKLVFSTGLAIFLLWLSLFFSYQSIPNDVSCANNPSTELSEFTIAVGGFPFKAFEYPGCYKGGDWPPSESWPLFFVNFIFWFIVAFLFSFVLDISKIERKNIFMFSLSSIFISIVGLAYLILMYD